MTNSKVTNVINHQGMVRTEGERADSFSSHRYSAAGSLVGLAWNNSTVSGNLNTGAVSTDGSSAYAGGAVGRASSSTVSGNLNSGAVSTEDLAANAGGIVGTALSNSVVSGNLNTGAISTMERYAFAGGAVGWISGTVSDNLNIGAVSTEGGAAFAGGTVGRASSSSMVSGNLNIGAVSTEGGATFAGGAVGFIHLLDLVISDTNSTYTVYPVTYPDTLDFGPRVNAMVAQRVAQGGRLYVTGRANGNVMVRWFQELAAGRFSDEDTSLTEYEQAIALLPDAGQAYVTSLKDGEVFLCKYDLQSLTQDTAFNHLPEQVLAQDNLGNSRQAIVFFKDRVYVASSVDSGQGLIVRRYHPESLENESFRVDEQTPSYDPDAQVALFTSDDFLHVLKYDRHGRIFAASYDTRSQGQVPVSDATIMDSPHFANVAPHGIAITDGKVYLAFQLPDNSTGELSIVEVNMPHLTVESARSPDSSSDTAARGWGVGTVSTVVTAVTAFVTVGCYLSRHQRKGYPIESSVQ